MPGIDETRPFIPVNIAVLTISDTRRPKDDESGAVLEARLKEAGHKLAARAIVHDDAGEITAQLKAWIADPSVDVVIGTGGTYLFAVPGSPSACKDAWDEVLKTQLDSRNRPCNLVQLMPRLQEHMKR